MVPVPVAEVLARAGKLTGSSELKKLFSVEVLSSAKRLFQVKVLCPVNLGIGDGDEVRII